MKYLKIILLLFLIAITSFSQQIKWIDINGVQNCYVLGEGADGKIFAMSETALYTSTDGGANWAKIIERGIMEEFASRKNVIVFRRYIANVIDRHRIEMSTDNGETWSIIFSDPRYELYDNIMINDSGIVFACAYNPAQLVRFNGSNWETIGTPISTGDSWVYDAVIDHLNNIYVVCHATEGDLLFVSTDYGNSWEKKMEVNGFSNVYLGLDNSVIVSKNEGYLSNGDVRISTNQGATWTYYGTLEGGVASIEVDLEGRIYAATSEGIYINDDRSTRWKYAGPEQGTFDDILITKNGVMLITAGKCSSSWCQTYSFRSTTIYRTTDRGIFWTPSSVLNQDVFSLLVKPSGQIYVGTLGSRIFITESGGVGWSQLSPGVVGNYTYSLTQHNQNIYAGTDEGLFVSSDNGKTWNNFTNGKLSGTVYAVVVNSNGSIMVGTNFGVYVSHDGGNSWSLSSLSGVAVLFMTIDKNDKIYAVTDNGKVWKSFEGTIWYDCNLNRDDIQTIAVNDVGEIFVGVYGGIIHSSDGGINWVENQFTNTYVYSIAFNSSQDIFAGTYNGVYVSRNNGQNWTFAGLNGSSVLSLVLDDKQIIYAGVYQKGVFRSEQSVTGVKTVSAEFPTSYYLYQNYPNPFNPTTKIKFSIPEKSQVSLRIFNILGQQVATILDETMMNVGTYEIEFDGSNLPSGIYFYRFSTGKFLQTRKMVLVE